MTPETLPSISSERVAPGTRLIIFRGGPPEWDGVVAAVSESGRGDAERWDNTADLALVYRETSGVEAVEVDRARRSGRVRERKDAVVYGFVGYRDEIEESQ